MFENFEKFLQDKFRNSPNKMDFDEMNAVIAKFGLTEQKFLSGKLYYLYNREVVYCPEDHRIGRAYSLYPDGIIDFEDEYTSIDKLEKFLMKKTKEIKDIKADLRMIKMKEDFDEC
jgi:hypothetical protein